MGASSPVRGAGLVLPIRAFGVGNARLAAALELAARAELAHRMAETVLAAGADLAAVVVVSDAPDVRSWASERGLEAIGDLGSLDAAATAGVAWCAGRGLARAVIAHADLPLARPGSLAPFTDAEPDEVVLVASHRDAGTPVLGVPTGVGFPFAYGPGSFHRHLAAARRLGLVTRVVDDPALAFDLDLPEDLARLDGAAGFRAQG